MELGRQEGGMGQVGGEEWMGEFVFSLVSQGGVGKGEDAFFGMRGGLQGGGRYECM